MMAVRIRRRGLRNREQNPKSKRSAGRRLGARRRDLCRTRSCCFKRILSARTARVPPVPRRMASPASRCPSNTIAFFIGKQLARYWIWRQGSRIAAEGPLNYEFAMHTVHKFEKSGDAIVKPCAQAWLTERAAQIMLGKGLMPVLSTKGRDAVRLEVLRSVAGTAFRFRWELPP